MQKNYPKVLIIGAGLTGLSLAYFLRNQPCKVTILEGRDRIGGRIHTLYGPNLPPREMGATWLGKKHDSLLALLDELDLDIFEQTLGQTAIYEPISTSPHQQVTLPPNDDPSYRIQGGTGSLIDTLSNCLEDEQFKLGCRVMGITQKENQLLVTTSCESILADYVVSTLPPYLLKETIAIEPALPREFLNVADKTHTWMGDSIKVSLTYDRPFWRDAGKSGTIFSNVGPIPEMYDHTDFENERFALKGFFNGTYHTLEKEERLAMALQQLIKYFGEAAMNYTRYDEAVWCRDDLTYLPYTHHVLPHQNNGHPLFRQPFLDGRFFVAGTETADRYPGYMDGAIRSAKAVAGALVKNSQASTSV